MKLPNIWCAFGLLALDENKAYCAGGDRLNSGGCTTVGSRHKVSKKASDYSGAFFAGVIGAYLDNILTNIVPYKVGQMFITYNF